MTNPSTRRQNITCAVINASDKYDLPRAEAECGDVLVGIPENGPKCQEKWDEVKFGALFLK